MQKIKIVLATLVSSASLVVGGLLLPTAALAVNVGSGDSGSSGSAASSSQQSACDGLSQLGSSGDCGDAKSDNLLGDLSNDVVQILLLIVGIASVIMIIISGLRYVTAGGDSNAVSSAKTGLIYALIGLIVASLAEFLTHYVLKHITT